MDIYNDKLTVETSYGSTTMVEFEASGPMGYSGVLNQKVVCVVVNGAVKELTGGN